MKQKIQIMLVAAIVVAGLRLAFILYERHEYQAQDAKKSMSAPTPVNPDYLVTPKKLRPYDLKSAGQLTQQPVWVKVGYSITYFPYNSVGHHADLRMRPGCFSQSNALRSRTWSRIRFQKILGNGR